MFPLCAKLRPADIDGAAGALKQVQRIVERGLASRFWYAVMAARQCRIVCEHRFVEHLLRPFDALPSDPPVAVS